METNPYDAPAPDAPATVAKHRVIEAIDGVRLGVARGRKLPRVCLVCAASKNVKLEKETVYVVSPVAWVSVLFGLAAIVAIKAFESAGLVKMAPLDVPRCQSCIASRQRISAMQGPIVVGLMIGLIGGGTLAGNGFPIVGTIVVVASCLTFAFALPRWGVAPWLKATSIDDDEIVLSGVHPDAVRTIARAP